MSEVVFDLPDVLPASEKEDFLNGCCHIFTIALAELAAPIQVGALLEKRVVIVGEEGKLVGIPEISYIPSPAQEVKEIANGLVHAFCVVDTTSNLIFDAKGIRDISELDQEYHLHDGVFLELLTDPNELLKYGHTFGERDNNVERYIEKTKTYIQTYLSDDLARINQT